MANEELPPSGKTRLIFGEFYSKHYKKLLLLPLIFFVFSIGYMAYFYNVNGDFIHKDISLTGGTSITIYQTFNISDLTSKLSPQLDNLNLREIYDLTTGEQKAVIIETTSDADSAKTVLEHFLGYQLTDENSSVEFTGSVLSESFYRQLLIAVLLAFVLMAIVVFVMFRSLIPSLAVILSAFADILMTLVTVNLLGINVSGAGIVAFLMLIGYSVDTDILLTNRVLKRIGHTVNEKIYDSFKTGITMTLTSLLAVFSSLLIVRSFSSVLSQIFTILMIGLLFDIFNTWITNASIIKWYTEHKHEN